MTLKEAAEHAQEVADTRADLCDECRQEHQQLADWLRELINYRKSAKVFERFVDMFKDELTMKIAGIETLSSVDGPGLRYTIFTQGCIHNCKGCHNPNTHNYDGGYQKFIHELLVEIDRYDQVIDGITLSGGDPLFILNYSSVLELCKKYKEIHPDKTIWLYTGYTYDEVSELRAEILNYIDVLVDGKFDQNLKSFEYIFRGSSNQRIIDVKKSLESDKIIEIPGSELMNF